MLVGPGRGRRRRRRRRRHRRRPPHREPQPPVGHRAVPGRGHRRRRHPPRHLLDGRPARSPPWTRCGSARSTTPAAAGSPRASSRASRATATPSASRPSAARSCSTRPSPTTRSSTCCASACCRSSGSCSAGRRASGNLAVLLGSSTGRDGIGGVSVLASAGFGDGRRRLGQAAERPGRRPVRGEAAHRGVPRAARPRPRRRRAGPRRRRPHRAPRARRRRKAGSGMDVVRLRGAPARAGHGAVRGHDLRVPGADARHRRAASTSTRCSPSPPSGRCGRRSSARSTPRAGCACSTGPAARCSPTSPPSRSRRTPRCYDRPRAEPADRAATRPPSTSPPSSRRRVDDPAAALLGDARRHVAGCSSQYDHQLFLNTVEAPGGDAAVLRLKHPTTGVDTGRAPGPHHRRQPPLVRRRPAGRAPRRSSPRRCSTSPSSAPARSPSSTTSTSATRSTPRSCGSCPRPIDGMAEACRALGIPVIGGNVSLYNESRGRDIDPTPVVGVLGVVDRLERRPPGVRLVDGPPPRRRGPAVDAEPRRVPARRRRTGCARLGHAARPRPRRGGRHGRAASATSSPPAA